MQEVYCLYMLDNYLIGYVFLFVFIHIFYSGARKQIVFAALKTEVLSSYPHHIGL